jgi:casein kinase II subunit alpha
MISLIWGEDWHIFKPDNVKPDNDTYPVHVLIKQMRFFGPPSVKYQELLDEERLQTVTTLLKYIHANNLYKDFSKAEDPELSIEDRDFICRIMKLDPRERPTAKELLEDPWLAGV